MCKVNADWIEATSTSCIRLATLCIKHDGQDVKIFIFIRSEMVCLRITFMYDHPFGFRHSFAGIISGYELLP